MMAGNYKKSVINMKNGYGRNICVILEEKNGQTSLLYNKEKNIDVYIYTDDGKYVKGTADGNKCCFGDMGIDDIKAVIIGRLDENGQTNAGSFVGYRKGECVLKPFKIEAVSEPLQKTEKVKAEEEKKEEVKVIVPEVKRHEYASVIKEYEEVKKQNSAEENFKKIMELFTKEISSLKDNNILSKEELDFIEMGKNEKKDSDTNRLFEECVPLTPFADSVYEWAMVSMEDMWRTDVKKCSAVLNDMSMLAEIKYHHLALGRSKDDGHFVFAVPEKFSEADKKHAKDLGFKDFWFCSKENSPFGYWIMDI